MEEAGCVISVKDKICSAETYCEHEKIGYFHPIQTYYIGELIAEVSAPVEKDHVFLWLEYVEIKGKMFVEMQNWALEQCFKYKESKYTNSNLSNCFISIILTHKQIIHNQFS